MKIPSTAICIFSYGGVFPATHHCIVRDAIMYCTQAGVCQLRDHLAEKGIVVRDTDHLMEPKIHYIPSGEDALIERTRAQVCEYFLHQCDHDVLVMIDHDISWQGPCAEYEGDVLHVARKAHEGNAIVGAAVAKKTKDAGSRGLASMLREKEVSFRPGTDQLLECWYPGSGFTAYPRSVIQAVYDTMESVAPGFRPIFMTQIVNHPFEPGKKLHLSEDWAFAHRARELGFDSFISTRPIITHWGEEAFQVTDACVKVQEDTAPQFSILHASRGRSSQAKKAMLEWTRRAGGVHSYEYILSIDEDDDLIAYEKEFSGTLVKIVIGPPQALRGPVSAMNRALYASTGKIIIQAHDDLIPPEKWDEIIFERLGSEFAPKLLHVDDGCPANPMKPWLLTILIGTRAWFTKAGYFYHPTYPSVYCDDDISQKAMKEDALIEAREIHFEHQWGGRTGDLTYAEAYRAENWMAGQRALDVRREAGFPDEPHLWRNHD